MWTSYQFSMAFLFYNAVLFGFNDFMEGQLLTNDLLIFWYNESKHAVLYHYYGIYLMFLLEIVLKSSTRHTLNALIEQQQQIDSGTVLLLVTLVFLGSSAKPN